MTITSSTVFDRVRLYAIDSDDAPDVIAYIGVQNNGQHVDWLRPRQDSIRYGWDTDSDEFTVVKEAIINQTATFEYYDKQRVVHQADALPRRLNWMAEANVIASEIAREQQTDDFGPVSLIVYKASVDKPTDDPPDYPGSWAAWRTAIEDAGFAVFQRPTATGEEKVWEIRASYGRSDGADFTEYDAWDTDTTLYSTDNGQTYTTARPANNQSGNSSITHIRRYSVSLGEWEDTPFSPQFQGVSTATDSLAQRSFGELTRGNTFIEASISLPRYYTVRGLQNGRTVKVGIELRYREAWNGPILLTGYTEIPDDRIPLVAPHEIEDDNAEVPVAGKTFLFVMDNVGQMNWGIIRGVDRVTDYHGDYHRFTAVFRSNATGTLRRGINATETVLRLSVKPRGIAQGTVLYFATADGTLESMTVTATPSFSPFVASQAEGGYEYWAVNVTRGGRAGPRAWASGARWYADFSDGQKHAQFVVFDKRNIHAASEISVFQVLDQ